MAGTLAQVEAILAQVEAILAPAAVTWNDGRWVPEWEVVSGMAPSWNGLTRRSLSTTPTCLPNQSLLPNASYL